ncbi:MULTISPECIES: ribonuclease P protein component 1 [unclassified Haloarchaeobius]|uniref:ribonuclease P protein component 1 n=1 Tax=unclassified Haloarchaeobius TaxID=2614452 RepID=UPI0026E55EFC|nr:ribonuclease P protein component 1 [Haloarchaeobius sp. HME9146]
MALTPETLPRHELNGLYVEVVDAANPDLVGIAGRIVIETMQTLHVEDRVDGESRVRQVPKQGTVFEFRLTDETADPEKGSGTTSKPGIPTGDDVAYVTVDGVRLLSRPALRTETTGDSKWR